MIRASEPPTNVRRNNCSLAFPSILIFIIIYDDILYFYDGQHIFCGIEGITHFGHPLFMVRPEQCRAARGLLAWSQQQLATEAGVGLVTIHQMESGSTQPRRATLAAIRRALEKAGVEFIDENGGGPGVRLRMGKPRKSGD
jgi:DNA-binding XRE family transcriptional regulator